MNLDPAFMIEVFKIFSFGLGMVAGLLAGDF